MITLDDFYKKLMDIENELGELEKYSEIYRQYMGNDFDGQELYAADLENMIISITHEIATEIGFARQDIADFIKYLAFRKKYEMFSGEQLASIINHVLTSEAKLSLTKQVANGDTKLLLGMMGEIKAEWNSLFNNEKYNNFSRQSHVSK